MIDAELSNGLYALSDLPQRGSVEELAYGAGWKELDEIFKFYPGQFVVVTGKAGQGKSTLVLNMLVSLAYRDGLVSFLYVPENELNLRAKLRGLWQWEEADFEYLLRTKFFIQTSIRDEEHPAHTMDWILSRAYEVVTKRKAEIVFIDPWNEIDRAKPKDMLLTDYIGWCIGQIKDFCRATSTTVIVCAHPTKAVNENGGRTAHLFDIEGSMHWFNKCDNGLVVVREEGHTARVISEKVREIGAGRLGICYFKVDPKTGIFTPQHGAVTL
jgi:twinkle protein